MSNYIELSDVALTDLLIAGDQFAFAEIYNRYKNPLFLHAYRMLQDDEEARDLVQELFAVIWTKREQLKISTTLDAYLYTSVKNKILNFIAHQKVIEKYKASLNDYLANGIPADDEKMMEKELIDIIEHEIAQLPIKMREIFELSRNEGLSHKQISEKLNISDKTVKKQIHNATKILRSKVNLHIFFLFM